MHSLLNMLTNLDSFSYLPAIIQFGHSLFNQFNSSTSNRGRVSNGGKSLFKDRSSLPKVPRYTESLGGHSSNSSTCDINDRFTQTITTSIATKSIATKSTINATNKDLTVPTSSINSQPPPRSMVMPQLSSTTSSMPILLAAAGPNGPNIGQMPP